MTDTILNNTYRLERALTEGGMGQVFIASHLRIKSRLYAIKQLRPELATAPNFQTRFQVEAEVMMELEHNNIVRIEDFLVQNGSYYLIMEFIEGDTLDGLLRKGGKMPPDEVHRMAVELLSALDYCHQRGIIHRDLKPSNLLLTMDNTLKITDFGIALQEHTDKRLTRTGTILGTPDYMSPEQIMSLPLDGRSDLYSTGIILFEMLRGIPPFPRSPGTEGSYQILFAHVHREAPILEDDRIPLYLRQAIEKVLKKDPKERFSSATEMLAFLDTHKGESGSSPELFAVTNPLVAYQQSGTNVFLREPLPSVDDLDASTFEEVPQKPAYVAPQMKTSPKRRGWWGLFFVMFFLGGSVTFGWWLVFRSSFSDVETLIEELLGLESQQLSRAKEQKLSSKSPKRAISSGPRTIQERTKQKRTMIPVVRKRTSMLAARGSDKRKAPNLRVIEPRPTLRIKPRSMSPAGQKRRESSVQRLLPLRRKFPQQRVIVPLRRKFPVIHAKPRLPKQVKPRLKKRVKPLVRVLPRLPVRRPMASRRKVIPKRIQPFRNDPPIRAQPRIPAPRPPVRQVEPIFSWPADIPKGCARFLMICFNSCTKQRIIMTRAFLNACRRKCWNRKPLRIGGKLFCPSTKKVKKENVPL